MPKRIDPEYLQGPIPGMSLTSEPGARPWENPPVYVNVEDVVEFYTERILDPETEDFVILVLEKGISVEATADYLVSSGVMNGMHTTDVAFLVTPVVRELIMYVADSAGIDYVESYDKLDREKRIPRRIAKEIVQEIFGEELEKKEEMEQPAPAAGGLMARRPAPPAPMGGGMMAPEGAPQGAMGAPQGAMGMGGAL